jgi:hypothetical protein
MHSKRIGIRGLKSSHSNKNGNSALACGEEKKKVEKIFCRPDRPSPNGYKIRTRNDRRKLIPNATEKAYQTVVYWQHWKRKSKSEIGGRMSVGSGQCLPKRGSRMRMELKSR